jgi:alkanesulfonate monooxygenase SsuD/methylene tetrahydromethanopterin reductase-like flavin-dependent oxidoreductase (luciferase family)
VVGSVRDIVEQLRAFTDLGFTGFNLVVTRDQVQPMADEVLPALRTSR